jgi:hypothetical protein
MSSLPMSGNDEKRAVPRYSKLSSLLMFPPWTYHEDTSKLESLLYLY